MWTRSGRPRLEDAERSLWERPRGLGSPGSQRRAGGGAGFSGSGTGAAGAGAAKDSPGGPEGRLPSSAIGSGGSGGHGAPGGAGAEGCPARRCPVRGHREAAGRAGGWTPGAAEPVGRAGGGRGQKSLHRKETPTAGSRSRGRKPQGSELGRPRYPPTCPAAPLLHQAQSLPLDRMAAELASAKWSLSFKKPRWLTVSCPLGWGVSVLDTPLTRPRVAQG